VILGGNKKAAFTLPHDKGSTTLVPSKLIFKQAKRNFNEKSGTEVEETFTSIFHFAFLGINFFIHHPKFHSNHKADARGNTDYTLYKILAL
jgi:hypothetical protein